MTRLMLMAALLTLAGCQSFHTVVVQPDGTRFESWITVPGWTEMAEKDVSLATGVYGADGEWYLMTGDTVNGLTQNPAVATAIVQGVVQGLAEAAKTGLLGPR